MTEEIVEISSGAMLRITKRDTTREGVKVMDDLLELEILNAGSFIVMKDQLLEMISAVGRES